MVVLGMHLTQVATMGCGRDCRPPASEMCAGSLLRSIGDADGLAPGKPSALARLAAETPPGQEPGAVPGHCCETRPAGNPKILGLPESSAYPVWWLSGRICSGRWRFFGKIRHYRYGRTHGSEVLASSVGR